MLEGKNKIQRSTYTVYGMLPFVQETKETRNIYLQYINVYL